MTNSLAAPSESAPAAPAGFWVRCGAYMIDSFFVGLAIALAFVVFKGVLSGPAAASGSAARLLISAAYLTILPAIWKGQTLGKRAAGIAIQRVDGEPLTYGRMFLRWVGYFPSILFLGAGVFMAAFRSDRRSLHDLIAGTRVVRAKEISTTRSILVVLAGASLPLIAILGVVAAVAIPILERAQQKAREAGVLAQLGSLHGSVGVYQAERGAFPPDLSAFNPPTINGLKNHSATNHVELYNGAVCAGPIIDAAKLKDTGGWGYVFDAAAPCNGRVFIDCKHTDVAGVPLSRY